LIEAEIEQIYDNELQAIQQNSIKFSKSFNSEKEIAENLIDEAKLNPNLKQFIRFIFAVEVD
jgi:FKBP-type peptidyl-prolyl cis-trans isomerase (trigger factor)